MKELSVKQKAKAYDEVQNKLRRFMAYGVDPLITRADVQDFFPELAESEDEKIRKELIAYCQVNMGHTWHDIKQDDYIAWLEKQGKKEPVTCPICGWEIEKQSEQRFIKEHNICDTCDEKYGCINPCPVKLVEQKPAWSEEDETKLNDAIDACKAQYGNMSYTADWLKSLKERVQPQTKYEWSDEHYELEEFAKIIRGNLTGISKAVQELFEDKYIQLTGNKMYGGFKD